MTALCLTRPVSVSWTHYILKSVSHDLGKTNRTKIDWQILIPCDLNMVRKKLRWHTRTANLDTNVPPTLTDSIFGIFVPVILCVFLAHLSRRLIGELIVYQ